jgi:formylmethanofuran dehydrogenase subunit E
MVRAKAALLESGDSKSNGDHMKSFEELLETSVERHGHLCPGQVVGVRMAMLGCRLIGLDDPSSHRQVKKLLVYVEMDRCAADAVALVTGAKLGRRSLKFMDYGIMAATFVNLETRKAYRVLSTEESRDLAFYYAPEVTGKTEQQLEAYRRMPDSVLFRVQEVHVPVHDEDMPGPTRYHAKEITWPGMNWSPRQDHPDGNLESIPCPSPPGVCEGRCPGQADKEAQAC